MRDPQAFEALVARYGKLVWGACRRRLKDEHAAEDAFQATFLALARHAGTIRRGDALAAWLHRTAVRCSAAFRETRGFMIASLPEVPARGMDPASAAASRELEEVIDAEIDALAEPFRQTFILCEVQQRSTAEAAKILGCAIGTIESRLTRSRQRLKARLTRRGVSVGSLVGMALLADAVPASARSGAIAVVTGSSPIPAGLTAIADQSVRVGIGTLTTVGVGVSASLGIVGLGGLVWALMQTPGPASPGPIPAPQQFVSNELAIPEAEQFRRNRANFPLPPEAIARVGEGWLRHGAAPTNLVYSANGKFVATGSPNDRWVRVWDLENGKPRAHLTLAKNESLRALALSDDGGKLQAVVQSEQQTLHLREYDTFRAQETRRRLLSSLPIESVVIQTDGKRVALARPGQVQVLETQSLKEFWRTDRVGSTELEFSANGEKLAMLDIALGKIQIGNAASGKIECELIDREGPLSMPRFNRDGKQLAAWCSELQRIRVWDVSQRQVVGTIATKTPLCGLAFSPNGERVVGYSTYMAPTMWSIREKDGATRGCEAMGGFAGWFSPDGTTLATTTESGTVVMLDGRTMSPVAISPRAVLAPTPSTFTTNGRRLLVEYFQSWIDHPTEGDDSARDYSPGMGPLETSLTSAGDRSAVSLDRTRIARCTAGDPALRAFAIDFLDAQSKAACGRIELKQRARRPAFSPNGKLIYASTADKLIHGWDVATGQETMRTDEPQTGYVSRLIVSPSGKHIATAQMVFGPGTRRESIRVFDANSGKQVFTANGSKGEPRIAFSPDGQLFAAVVGSERAGAPPSELRVWDAVTGRERVSLSGYSGQPSFSPDGRTLAVNQDDGVVLIELTTAKARHAFQHHGKVEPAITWRADGRVLAASSPEAPVYLWDVAGDRTGFVPVWESQQNDRRWLSLVEGDSANAFGTLRQLWANPKQAVEFLRERMNETVELRVASRGCEALEMIRNEDAMKLLAAWSAGEASSPLTIEAKESLKRLRSTH